LPTKYATRATILKPKRQLPADAHVFLWFIIILLFCILL